MGTSRIDDLMEAYLESIGIRIVSNPPIIASYVSNGIQYEVYDREEDSDERRYN